MKKFYTFIVLGLVTLGFFSYFHNQNRLLLTFFPPEGLYDPIKIPFNLTDIGDSITVELNHKYVGTYFYGFYIEKMPDFDDYIKTNSVISVSINKGKTHVLNKQHSRWVNWFGGACAVNSGVILGHYDVPTDLSRSTKYEMIVTIAQNDIEFVNNYGKRTFFIKRSSDL